MRIKSRLGVTVTVSTKRILRQEQHTKGSETYYVLLLTTGKKIEVGEPVPGVPTEIVQPTPTKLHTCTAPEYRERQLPRAEDCPSAGLSMVAGTTVDHHAHEKVKGETFFTHKTASATIIKSPKGEIIHDVKMDDMYRRRV